MNFTINPEKCTSCGICIAECPSKTIKKETESARIISDGCIECSHCGMVCPVNAVRVDGNELPPYPESMENLTSEEMTDHLIKSKRSVRKYKTAPINKEDLQAIILAGETTATASNTQHCDALVFQGGEVAALASSIAGILTKFTRIGLNPVGRFFLKLAGLKRYADKEVVTGFHHLLKKTQEGKADPLFYQAPAVVILTYPKKGKRFGITDCGIAGETMMLTAHSRNIGSCMIGFAQVALFSKKQRVKLGIPADRQIGLIFTLGYSDRQYYRYPVRKNWSHLI
ncbi:MULTISPECIES: nitroreductase family protein [unclassified Oceanispirochaeta]|uniref:nitroreductase family protein n=1 Tax=unclassified Oceanispirochaeta TaxID=2635722 RepID=UPI000E173E69|nr:MULTISPECIES: nitroreductase family protein [unclassified Oceanispirochaeta]MBF9015531.1 nitroreductase family protein [Oceanispirochaeta sp. M2]NPD71990.1 4Fe-4S binding protein [Oceanispirochaeta sp. M1]RDG32796.1 4Fe-4S dicluster domain-containing protein [Oceanispirochaeta sp. M1]